VTQFREDDWLAAHFSRPGIHHTQPLVSCIISGAVPRVVLGLEVRTGEEMI
jgi:hypothetical protein